MSIIQFLINNDYSIPRFCYHGLLSIAGNCRVCVIDDRESKTSVSCALCYESYRFEFFNDGVIIGVNVKNVISVRENIFEFLLLSHPLDCPICDRGGECELQDMTNSFGADRGRVIDIKGSLRDKHFNIAISTHMSRCITCGRCVRFLREVVECFNIGIVGRGNISEVSGYTSDITTFEGVYSSNIIDLCPVSFSKYISDHMTAYTITYISIYLFYNNAGMCFNYLYSICSTYIYNTISWVICYKYLSVLNNNLYFFRLYYSLPATYYSRKLVDDVYECVLCASCTASCPSYWWNSNSYLGPAVLLQAYRWIVNSNDSDFFYRLDILDLNYNISLCHSIGNCYIVCPKNLDPADRISDIKSILGTNINNFYYY